MTAPISHWQDVPSDTRPGSGASMDVDAFLDSLLMQDPVGLRSELLPSVLASGLGLCSDGGSNGEQGSNGRKPMSGRGMTVHGSNREKDKNTDMLREREQGTGAGNGAGRHFYLSSVSPDGTGGTGGATAGNHGSGNGENRGSGGAAAVVQNVGSGNPDTVMGLGGSNNTQQHSNAEAAVGNGDLVGAGCGVKANRGTRRPSRHKRGTTDDNDFSTQPEGHLSNRDAKVKKTGKHINKDGNDIVQDPSAPEGSGFGTGGNKGNNAAALVAQKQAAAAGAAAAQAAYAEQQQQQATAIAAAAQAYSQQQQACYMQQQVNARAQAYAQAAANGPASLRNEGRQACAEAEAQQAAYAQAYHQQAQQAAAYFSGGQYPSWMPMMYGYNPYYMQAKQYQQMQYDYQRNLAHANQMQQGDFRQTEGGNTTAARSPNEAASEGGGSDDDGDDEARAVKRPRLIWTNALHRRFLTAVEQCGGVENALPKAVMQMMRVNGLTRENVASHLQKYRLRQKKEQREDDDIFHEEDKYLACDNFGSKTPGSNKTNDCNQNENADEEFNNMSSRKASARHQHHHHHHHHRHHRHYRRGKGDGIQLRDTDVDKLDITKDDSGSYVGNHRISEDMRNKHDKSSKIFSKKDAVIKCKSKIHGASGEDNEELTRTTLKNNAAASVIDARDDIEIEKLKDTGEENTESLNNSARGPSAVDI